MRSVTCIEALYHLSGLEIFWFRLQLGISKTSIVISGLENYTCPFALDNWYLMYGKLKI